MNREQALNIILEKGLIYGDNEKTIGTFIKETNDLTLLANYYMIACGFELCNIDCDDVRHESVVDRISEFMWEKRVLNHLDYEIAMMLRKDWFSLSKIEDYDRYLSLTSIKMMEEYCKRGGTCGVVSYINWFLTNIW